MKPPTASPIFRISAERIRQAACLLLSGAWLVTTGSSAFAIPEDSAAEIEFLKKEIAAVRADQKKTLEALDEIREQLRILKIRVGKNG